MEGEANKQWIYVKRPEGEVTEEHYKLVKTPVPQLGEGEVLLKALFITVDPYMRIQQAATNTWEAPHPLNKVQGAGAVGEVLVSNDTTGRLKKGDVVLSYSGWQTHAVVPAASCRKIDWDPKVAPYSYALGVLGMPGRTAYFGLYEAGKPKAGETVVVSGAAGAVGSIVVQLAKIRGCRVVAIAGSDDKLRWLKEELSADEVLNYKGWKTVDDARQALEQACPKGVDVYFDNVGGIITDAIILHFINTFARVIICGQISQYEGHLDNPQLGPRFLHRILYTRATIQGILARDYNDRMDEMLQQMVPWLSEGKLKYAETVVEGFEKLPSALNSLFSGKNTGKLVVKV